MKENNICADPTQVCPPQIRQKDKKNMSKYFTFKKQMKLKRFTSHDDPHCWVAMGIIHVVSRDIPSDFVIPENV